MNVHNFMLFLGIQNPKGAFSKRQLWLQVLQGVTVKRLTRTVVITRLS